MDAAFLNELLECSVCLEQLDSTSRVLPCQHTFCKRCLQEIVQSKGELRCPECRTLVETKVDELPVNIFLVRLLEGIKNKTPRKCQSSGQPILADPLFMGGAGLCPGAPSIPLGAQSFYMHAPAHPTCCAKAIYPYESANASDLSFQKGDLINLIKRIDVNWYQGELKGKVGFVPASYITVITLGPLATALSQGSIGHFGQGMVGQAVAKALYDFQITEKSSEEKECLTFSRGELIYVLRRVDENWAEGRVGDRQGIFPISFVEMNVAAKQLIKMITCSGPSRVAPAPPTLSSSLSDQGGGGAKTPNQTPEGLLSDFSIATENKRHSLSALNLTTGPGQALVTPTSSSAPSSNPNSEHRHSMEILSDRDLQSPMAPLAPAVPKLCQPPISVSATTVAHSAQLGGNKLLEINAMVRRPQRHKEDLSVGGGFQTAMFYIALYNYKPQKEDELELKKGEVYMVSEKCQDGWFKGSALKSGAQGVFPGNYVQPAGKGAQQAQQQSLTSSMPFYSAAGSQQAPANPALLQGFANLCVSSPMRPRSNPQLPLTALYGATQRSSEWPLSTQSGTFGSSFGDVVVGSSAVPCGAPLVGVVGGTNAGLLKCGQSSGGGLQQGQQYRSAAPVKSGWTSTDLGGSPPNLQSQQPSPQAATVIAQHLSLVKRLTRHKSKSPPPALGLGLVGGGAGLDDFPPVHIRSGSCPSSHSSHSSPAGPSGGGNGNGSSSSGLGSGLSGGGGPPTPAPGPLHKKTASLDDALASPTSQPSPLTPFGPLLGGLSGVSPPAASQQQLVAGQTPNLSGGSQCQTSTALEQYRCIVPYPANSDYELELKVGDVVYVHKKRDDGWCKGTLQRTGRTGLFPASFVKQIMVAAAATTTTTSSSSLLSSSSSTAPTSTTTASSAAAAAMTTAMMTTTMATAAMTAAAAMLNSSKPAYATAVAEYGLSQGHVSAVGDSGSGCNGGTSQLGGGGGGGGGQGNLGGHMPPAPAMFQCGPATTTTTTTSTMMMMGHATAATHILNPPH